MDEAIGLKDWSALLDRLGPAAELEAGARAAGALRRRRRVGSAADLLRLCFAFVLGRLSLRLLAAWAEERGVASASDVALLKRLRASADWVGDLVAERLAGRYPEGPAEPAQDRRLVAVDATAVVPPGDKRDYWLVHTVFDLTDLRLRAAEVTDRFEPERLSRGGPRAGEVRLGDRGHARVEELAAVAAAGADFLIRLPSTHPRLLDAEGRRLDRLALVRQARRAGRLDRVVVAASGKTSARVEARLVILPLPAEAAERARRATRASARRIAATRSPSPWPPIGPGRRRGRSSPGGRRWR